MVSVHVSGWQLEVYYSRKLVVTLPRLAGPQRQHINCRHIIESLLRKPGGFRDYRYREALFPRLVFRQACERLNTWYSPRRADLIYLRILHLAAQTLENDVTAALQLLLQRSAHFTQYTTRLPSATSPAYLTCNRHPYPRSSEVRSR